MCVQQQQQQQRGQFVCSGFHKYRTRVILQLQKW